MIEVFGTKKQTVQTPVQKQVRNNRPAPAGSSRRNAAVIPVKSYSAAEVRKIRVSLGFSQSLFADYMGVSVKTVEAWEAGTNIPSGAASRLLMMMEMDDDLTSRYPFVVRH